jgi:hypothetical protein
VVEVADTAATNEPEFSLAGGIVSSTAQVLAEVVPYRLRATWMIF